MSGVPVYLLTDKSRLLQLLAQSLVRECHLTTRFPLVVPPLSLQRQDGSYSPRATASRPVSANICSTVRSSRITLRYAACRRVIPARILRNHNELTHPQEVDRTEKLFPELEKANYAWVYAAGPRKKHGCLIAFRKDAFECVREKVITYDDEEVRRDGPEKARRGSSFRTKNIASLVALRMRGSENGGVIVATTHLFWHPA